MGGLRALLLCAAAACLPATGGAKVWEFPALGSGPNGWSLIKLKNKSAAAKAVTVDVFDQDGERMPIGPHLTIDALDTAEIRIEKPSPQKREACWARITGPDDLEISAFSEVLHDNIVETYRRDPGVASNRSPWIFSSGDFEGKTLYFLNTTDRTGEVTFCFAYAASRSGCLGGISASRYPLKPRQAIAVRPGRSRARYFIVQSSSLRAMMVVLSIGPGERKMFSSDSTIEFGDPAQ
jgi:hypothetical protein